ncbi:glycosyltransferase family 4 protein [Desulfurella sp.]|uniref:glycosyltransferase family 4 protein n=1 Tax=Desulfurella sp. TaxID=1962857 RepID=UPI003D13BC9E
MLKYIIIAFLVCSLVDFLIIVFSNKLSIGLDKINNEPQKFHKSLTPRLGGTGIFLAFLVISFLLFVHRKESDFLLLALCATPAFLVGLTEDISRKVKPIYRLLVITLSAGLGILFLGALLNRLDLGVVDKLFSFKAVAVIVTLIAVSGVTNAFNIIDGYNGLASFVSIIIFLGFAYVAFKLNDMYIVYVCFAMIFSIFAFFLLNYPLGKIFLGDGGAYFIGFIAAEVAVLIVVRHKQVSAFFPLLLCIYPIFETIFSMYRRKIIKKSSVGKADALHLHTLVFRRMTPLFIGSNPEKILYRNSMTSPFLWVLTVFSALPAILFWNDAKVLIVFSIIFMFMYIGLYWSIVKFKISRIMKFNKSNKL